LHEKTAVGPDNLANYQIIRICRILHNRRFINLPGTSVLAWAVKLRRPELLC
jgi:hypothetical protein